MRNFVFVFNFLLVCLSPAIVSAQGIKFFSGTWAEAKAKAKQENKPIFVDVYAVWCGPCKYMTNSVFTQKSVGDYFNANFISLKIDAEKGEGPTFASNNNVRAYPTLLFFDSNGKVVINSSGTMEAEELLEKGKTVAKANPNNGGNPNKGGGTQDDVVVDEGGGNSDENGGSSDDNGGVVDFNEQIIDFRAGKLSIEEMQIFLINWFVDETQTPKTASELFPILWQRLSMEEKLQEENLSLAHSCIRNVNSDVLQDIIKNKARFIELYESEVIDGLLESVIESQFLDHFTAQLNGENPSKEILFKDIAKTKPDILAYYKSKYRYYDAIYSQKDDDELRAARKDYHDNHAKMPYELDSEAWQVVSTNGEYDSYNNALIWINKSLDIYESGYALAVKGWLLFKTNKKEQARKFANQAKELAEAQGDTETVDIAQNLLNELN